MAFSPDVRTRIEQCKYKEDDGELHDDFSYDCDDEPDAPPGEPDRRSGSVDRAGVLAAIGYRPDSQWQAAAVSGADEACERCGRKVYPVEKVDIGVIYHRGCFRCRICNLQLTLKTFLASEEVSADGARRTRAVYCTVHLPKQTRGHITGEAVGIRSALEAQRRATAKGHKSVYEPGWNFNPNTPCTGEYEHEQQQQLQEQYEQVQQMEQTREEQQQLQDEYQQLQQRKQQQEERLQRLKEQQRQLQQEQQEQQLRLQQQQEMLQQQAQEQLLQQREQEKQQQERMEKRQQMQKAQQEQQQKQLKIQQQEEQLKKQHELLALQQQQMRQQQQELLLQQQKFEEQQRSLQEQRQRLQQLSEIQEQQQIVLQQQKQQQLLQKQQQQQQKQLQEQQQQQQEFEQQQQKQLQEQQQQQQLQEKQQQQQFDQQQQQFEHQRQPQMNTPTSPESGTLKSYKDFERHGVFDAQAALEEKHRQEEDALYRQIFDDRKSLVANMERRLAAEKEKAVRELLVWFDKRGASAEERKEGMNTLDEYFKSERERRVQQLMQRLAAEEEAAVARMVEKHSQEMLRLISDKEKGLKENNDGDDGKEGSTEGEVERKQEYTSSASTSSSSKSSVGDREDMFGKCDTLAIREAGREHTTFTGLVRNLSKRCANEMQKLRAIFRWITVKNLNQLHLDESHPSESPLGLLRGIQLGTESYHTLFKRLCSYAGLQCEVIDGYSKGAGYTPGMRLQGNAFRNQWTAVWVDGAWRFINCNWGARHVTGRAGVAERLTYKCDEFYFLTDPAEHIYQHFPDNDSWQLLKKTITLAQFVRLPLLKSPFFNARLSLVAPQCCAMRTDTGSANFQFRVRTSVRLDATLRSPSKDGKSTTYDDRTYIRQVDDQVVCGVALPRPGGYLVDVYVTSSWEPDTMDLACVFRVRCTAALPTWMSASYPPGTCFGRTPVCRQLGLAEQTHNDPYIEHKGELVITFSLAADVRLSHTLQRWSSTNRSLTSFDRHALLNRKDDSFASYVIRCPRSGSYVFSIYAAPSGGQTTPDMACVYHYLLRCLETGKNTSAMPQASTRWHHCRLVEPMVGDLPANARVRFTIDSAVAMEMLATVNQGGWQSLEKTGRLWQGTITTGSEQGKLMVYGRFDPTREKYVPLMEYKVVASS